MEYRTKKKLLQLYIIYIIVLFTRSSKSLDENDFY